MSIRNKALMWYEKKYGGLVWPTYSSKFYQPEESWPKKSVWWFQIPLSKVDENLADYINILCQVEPNEYDFHYLKVPTGYFQKHLENFHILQEKISLYLSTDPKRLFVEERGEGNLIFRNFLVTDTVS